MKSSLLIIISVLAAVNACAEEKPAAQTAAGQVAAAPKPCDADFPLPTPNERHTQKVAAIKAGNFELAMLGDSITQCVGEGGDAEWDSLKAVWDKYNRKYNRSAKGIAANRRANELTAKLADGNQVFWLDVGPVLLRPDGTINTDLMPDMIHPNAAGAEARAKAMEPLLTKLLGEKPKTATPPP